MGVVNYIAALFTSKSLISLPIQSTDEISLKRGSTLYRTPAINLLTKTYSDTPYDTAINLNIKGDYKNIPDASGNFTVNASNNTKGDDYIFTIKKTVEGVINLTFGTGFTGAAITALKAVNYSSGNVVSLAGGINTIYTVTLHFQTEGVIISVDQNRSTDSGLL